MAIDLTNFDPQPIVAALNGLQIGQLLGRGGQKAVWHCTYQGHEYVLKVMVGDPDATERAKREVEIYRRCTSEYLPQLGPLSLNSISVGTDVVLYYLEERIGGVPLSQVTKPIAAASVIAMALCITNAIEELWKNGFVHRDIKPANIMQQTNGRDYVLLDAGLALDSAGPSLTQTGGIVGTTGYRSPDQLQMNKRDLDFRSDFFALGICMYECLTGQHPFWNQDLPRGDIHFNTVQHATPPPQRWNATIPADLSAVIMRLLEKDRHLRYSRFDHLRDDLGRIVI